MSKTKIILTIVALLLVIQIIPYGKNHTNPKAISHPNWDSQRTKKLFYRACGDCHSFQTKWPSYSNIAPISWLVYNDVAEGRDHFNVSNIGGQKRNKLKEAAKSIKEGEMPMFIYTIMHKNARLSDKEKQDLVKGLQATFGK